VAFVCDDQPRDCGEAVARSSRALAHAAGELVLADTGPRRARASGCRRSSKELAGRGSARRSRSCRDGIISGSASCRPMVSTGLSEVIGLKITSEFVAAAHRASRIPRSNDRRSPRRKRKGMRPPTTIEPTAAAREGEYDERRDPGLAAEDSPTRRGRSRMGPRHWRLRDALEGGARFPREGVTKCT